MIDGLNEMSSEDTEDRRNATESKSLSTEESAIRANGNVSVHVNVNMRPDALATRRRYYVWTQIVVVFLFLECALWAETHQTRNRWSLIAAVAIGAVLVTDKASGKTSVLRLGLKLPTVSGALVVVGTGIAAAFLLLTLAKFAGEKVPANPTWFPNLRSIWGYVAWALMQEFILQSFFFTRGEELYGSQSAVWIASALFAVAHLPNPVLTLATLFGALFFCEMFRRFRSIYPLAVVHAMLGITVAFIAPDRLLHHMRVGIGYLRY